MTELDIDVNPWSVSADTEKGVDYDKLIGKLYIFSNIIDAA